MDMNKQSYSASDTVSVDEQTAEFVEEAEQWAEEVKTRREEIRTTVTNQALFKQGVRAWLTGECDTELHENSDAYFQGQDYGRRLTNEISAEAVKRFPTIRDTDKVKQYGEALLKRQIEVEKFK